MTHPPDFSINGRFLHAAPTGVQRVAYNLIRSLDSILEASSGSAQEFEVLTPAGPRRSLPTARIPIREIGRSTGQVWEQLALPTASGRGQLINFCNAAPLLADSAVTMIHDGQVFITPESYSRKFAGWYRFSQPRICARAKFVLTVSEYSKRILVENRVAPEDKIMVIHNGIDHVLSFPAIPETCSNLGLVPFDYVVIFANFQKHKNFELILRLWARGYMDRLKLVVIGDVDWDGVKSHYGLDAIPDVLLAGRLSDGAVRSLLESAVCLAFPSTTEGFGLPPLEAMLLGCPVVVAPMGAVPEVCGEAAIYADPDRPDAWRAAILEQKGRGQEPQQRADLQSHASAFTWRRAADQLLALLDRV